MPGPVNSLFAWFCLLSSLYVSSLAERRLCGQLLADTLDMVCEDRGFNLAKRNGRSVGQTHVRVRDFSPLYRMLHKIAPAPPSVHGTGSSTISDHNDVTGLRKDNLGGASLADSHAPVASAAAYDGSGGSRQQNEGGARPEHKLYSSYYSPSAQMGGSKVAGRSRREVNSRIVDECCLRPCNFATLQSYCADPDDPVVEIPEDVLRQRLGFTTQRPAGHVGQTGRRRQTTSRPSAEINTGSGHRRLGSFFCWRSGINLPANRL
ncbi:insulin-like 0 precursor [Aplysia californica]|uniref:Insulin-like 0 n=1 Tax=Aplysia californica TaxID=6500 RepID=A1XP48_APLCA|nr:insulin-like 0 precursor [Aplysia californica]ABF18972.1 insulin-like 0 [Aplysia californica]